MEDYKRCLDNIRSYNSTLCNSFDKDFTYNSPYQNYLDCCCFCHRNCCQNNCIQMNYSMNSENYLKNNNDRLNQLECEKMSLENLNKNLQKQIEMYSKFDNDVMKENEALKGMLNKSVDVFKAVEEKSQLPQNKVFGNNLNYYLDKPNEFNSLMNSQSNWIKNPENQSLSSTLKNDKYSNNPFGAFNMNNGNYPYDDNNNKFYTFHNQPKYNVNDGLNNSDYNPLNNRDFSNNYSPNLNSTSNFGKFSIKSF